MKEDIEIKLVRIEENLENVRKNMGEGFAHVTKTLGEQANTMEGMRTTINTVSEKTLKIEWSLDATIKEMNEFKSETAKQLNDFDGRIGEGEKFRERLMAQLSVVVVLFGVIINVIVDWIRQKLSS